MATRLVPENYFNPPPPSERGLAHINLAGDGGGDEGSAVFLQPFNRLLHLPHRRVQLRRLFVKIRGDGGLFGEGWEANRP